MKNYAKVYIGKGRLINDFALRITISVEKVLEYAYEKGGAKYLTFEVAKMKNPDEFGKTHTAWVSVLEKPAKTEAAPEQNEVQEPDLFTKPVTTPETKPAKRKAKHII